MQLTLRGALIELEEEDRTQIDDLMRTYQSAKRYSFNRLLGKQNLNDLKKDVMAKFGLNARYSYAAIVDAKATELIKSQAIKEEIGIKEVNPKFSSFIGEYKYSSTYGLSVHQSAAFVIARRAMGYMERVPKQLIMFINFVKKGDPLVKPMEGFKKWGLLYGVMKRAANSRIRKVLHAFSSSLGLDDAETADSVLHGAIPCPTRRS